MKRLFGFTGFGFSSPNGFMQGPTPFNPSTLFAGSPGGFWNIADLTTVFQNSNATGAPAVGSPVGYVGDQSGNGNHLKQATAGLRPTLRNSGNLYWLEFNGSQWMQALFTINPVFDRLYAVRQDSYSAWSRIMDGGTATESSVQSPSTSGSIQLYAGLLGPSAVADIGTSVVITERHDGAASRIAANNGSYATGDNAGAIPGGITVGAEYTGGTPCTMSFFSGLMIDRALSASEITQTRYFMAATAGLTI